MKRDSGRIVLSPKERFWELENFKYYDPQRTAGKYNFPTNEPTQHWPKGLVGFHTINDDPEQYANGVHFYIHDYKFECLWNKPERYFERFSKYDCIIAPDFSTYTDMSLAHVIWNTYRNRLLVQMMQDYGITVIPNIMWGAEETFEFCFVVVIQAAVNFNNQFVVWDRKIDPILSYFLLWNDTVTEPD